MSLLDTIKLMARELAYVGSFLAGACGVAMISVALDFDPIWPVIIMFFGFLLILGGAQ